MTYSYNLLSIIMGISILFSISFILVLAVSAGYELFVLRLDEINWRRNFPGALGVSLLWLIFVTLSIWLASSLNVWVFGVFASFLLYVPLYYSSEKLFGVHGKHKVAFALLLAVILNPGWFILLGVA